MATDLSLVKIMLEIGELTPNTFDFGTTFVKAKLDGYLTYINSFQDENQNHIKVSFSFFPKGELQNADRDAYNVGFSVNGKSTYNGIENSDSKYYLRLISTVVKIIIEFVKQFEPEALLILGDGFNDKKTTQKNKIYFQYLKRNTSKEYAWQIFGDYEALYVYKRNAKELIQQRMSDELFEYIKDKP